MELSKDLKVDLGGGGRGVVGRVCVFGVFCWLVWFLLFDFLYGLRMAAPKK